MTAIKMVSVFSSLNNVNNNNNNDGFFNACVSAIKNHPNYLAYANGEKVSSDTFKLVNGNSPVYKLTKSTVNEGLKHFDQGLLLESLSLGQKPVMRLIQALNCINQGLYSKFDIMHARTLLVLWADRDNKSGTTTNTISKIASNSRLMLEGNNANLRNKVNKILDKTVGNGALETKKSNSVGKNGYMQFMGITVSEGFGHNRPVYLNTDSSFVKAFLVMINKLTDNQLEAANLDMIEAWEKDNK